MDPLIFLLKLAWESRYRLPLLITIGFMILDVRMQLEIHIQTRTVRRPPPYENDVSDSELESNQSFSGTEDEVDDDEGDETKRRDNQGKQGSEEVRETEQDKRDSDKGMQGSCLNNGQELIGL